MGPKICLSKHFSSRVARGCMSSVTEMGWEELDPLKRGTGSTPKTLTPLLLVYYLHQNPPGLLTPPNPFSSSRVSSPLSVLQFHQLFGSRTSPGRTGPGTPRGCGSARPRAGILLQPPERCRQRCRSGDSWECEWGSEFAEARPPGQGGNQKQRGHGKALPLTGEFSG